MKISHRSKIKIAVICILLSTAFLASSNAFAEEEKGFLVRLWERFTSKPVQEAVEVRKAPEPKEVKAPEKVSKKASDEPAEEEKGFFARMWENIKKRFVGKPEESVSDGIEPVASKPAPIVIEQKSDEEILKDVSDVKMSKNEILGKIEQKLGDKPYLVDSVRGLSRKKSVMDGKMYYFYSPVDGIPEKIIDLDRDILLALLNLIDAEDVRLGDVDITQQGPSQMMPTEEASPYQPAPAGEPLQPGTGAGVSPIVGGEIAQGEAPQQGPSAGEGPTAPQTSQAPQPSGETSTPQAPSPSAPSEPQPPIQDEPAADAEPEIEEEEEEREIPHTKDEMLDVIGKRLKVFGEIEYIIPNLFSRIAPDGQKEYYYAPDGGVALKLRDLDKGDLFDLYVRVNNEATRINTERILRQIQQQEQIMRQIQLQQQQMQQQQVLQPPQPPQQPPQPPQVYTPPQPPAQHQVPTPPPAPPQTRQ